MKQFLVILFAFLAMNSANANENTIKSDCLKFNKLYLNDISPVIKDSEKIKNKLFSAMSKTKDMKQLSVFSKELYDLRDRTLLVLGKLSVTNVADERVQKTQNLFDGLMKNIYEFTDVMYIMTNAKSESQLNMNELNQRVLVATQKTKEIYAQIPTISKVCTKYTKK